MKSTIFALLIITLTIPAGAAAQDNQENPVAASIRSQHYVFKATTAMPLRGRTVQLTSDYSLTIRKDSVIAFLPYFGRAYSAPIGRTTGGIDFTSTDFTYKADERKKGGWEIEIRPKDADDVQVIVLSLSKNGYGRLNVTSQNRQAISFNGYVEKERK